MTIRNQQGIILITTVIFTSVIASLGLYVIAAGLAEHRIARAHAHALQAYYAAEAGSEHALWRLGHDASYQTSFEQNPDWIMEFSVTDVLASGLSYTATLDNAAEGYANVSSVGSASTMSGSNAKRVAAMKAFRAWGLTSLGENALYVNDNVNISAGSLYVYDGDIFFNDTLDLANNSSVYAEHNANIIATITTSIDSELTIAGTAYTLQNNPPGPPGPMAMPAIDFDSTATSSYASLANTTVTASAFETSLQNNEYLTLTDAITYVNGNVSIRGSQMLTINGMLVIDGDLTVGDTYCSSTRCGWPEITVNYMTGSASGILVQGNVSFLEYAGAMNMQGVLYVNDVLTVTSTPAGSALAVSGGVIARILAITSPQEPITITYNNAILRDTLHVTAFSQVINIEHWEESY